MSAGRYRVEQFIAGDWVVMADSDIYLAADEMARVLLHAGAKIIRVVDSMRLAADQVVWSMTTR